MKIEKVYNLKRIKVEEVDCAYTSWGAKYSLYVDGNGDYYADEDDGSDNVVNITPVYSNIKEPEARELFSEYIEMLEAMEKLED